MEEVEPENALSMPIPTELDASDGGEWFHFQSHSLPSWGAFSRGKRYSAVSIAKWKPSLSGVVSDETSREVCHLWMNV